MQLTIAGVGALTVTGYDQAIIELSDAHGGSHRLDLLTGTLQ